MHTFPFPQWLPLLEDERIEIQHKTYVELKLSKIKKSKKSQNFDYNI